jgi:ferric-dicitrate binding protein FerR (iron transport regulator)
MNGSEIHSGGLCQEVEERLSEVLDGSAPATLFEHIAECDTCRDRRHEATRAAEVAAVAGADFRPAADFAEQILARVQAARPGAPAAPSAPPTSSAPAAPAAAPVTVTVTSASSADEPNLATNPTVLAPTSQAPTPVSPTLDGEPSAPAAALPPAPSTVSATSHHGVESAASEQREAARASDAPSPKASDAVTAKAPAASKSAAAPALVKAPPAKAQVVPLFKRPIFVAGAAFALAAAAGVSFLLRSSDPTDRAKELAQAPWSGKVAAISRASADKTGGLEACDAAGACAPVESGAEIRPGTTLRTDARTRAHIALADGTELAIDRASQVELAAREDRTARLGKGTIVADVAKVEGATPARFLIPQGDIEVLGTKLALSADEERASVEVARGEVRLRDRSGKTVNVRAGEEATLGKNGDPVVASTTSLADVMEWSDRTAEEVDAPVLKGLGELRARKPGQTKERDRAVRLAKHAVKVRIVDVVARTEVDETFANDTDEELEGIFRFPLPPGAQIERLALEVDGKLMEGAFVDRDRGAAIWRGVIQNAAPKAPKPREEIIWVPGPWRDPALLEWQRGGRFELKIFPIPKRGSRRVVLTYTQLVDQAAGVRRFTYPLAHDTSGTTKVDSFDIDLQVLGHDKSFGVATRGYDLKDAPSDGAAERRTLSASGFTPSGDLSIEYALPDRDREVTAWAYKMDASAQAAPLPAVDASKAKTTEEKAAAEAAQAISSDASPYVAIAVRPKLPRWQEAKERVHVLVVDSSRSMIGERYARATRLASSIVREMDRRDTFITLACDTVCRSMPSSDGGGASSRPASPGASAAGDVERFLGSIEPDGGSDLAAAMMAARTAAGSVGNKELRIIYLGDGTPTVGPTRSAHIETAVKSAMPGGDAAVIAVALGADADVTSLQALARGGGGVVVPYVPGQKVSSAALDVLGAAYGVVMRDPEVELPAGLTQVTPARLDPIRAGGEAFIVARMSGGSDVSGSIKLKGRVAGERFEQAYPVKILATSSAGNAFVPRLYAAAKIAELERVGGETQKATVVELSKRFAVASRFTSLLVLESEAMFKAFGLDRGSVAPTFTGEEQAESSSADAEGKKDAADEELAGAGEGFGSGHGRLGGSHAESDSKKKGSASPRDMDFDSPFGGVQGQGFGGGGFGAPGAVPTATAAGPMRAEPRPDSAFEAPAEKPSPPPPPMTPQATSQPKPAQKVANNDPVFDDRWDRSRRQRFVPMKRIFERNGAFEAVNSLAKQNASKLVVAESSLATTPDSRDKTVELYALYATSGRLGEAQELTARWSGRDALDPDAIIARADLAARQGDRERATRILGGLADVRPGDRAMQVRLAELHEAAGNLALACEHRIALAGIAMSDAKLVADAVRCSRAQGMNDLASQLRADTIDKVREIVDRLLAANPAASAAVALRGDVQISAQWTGGEDLDIALIDAQGKRISWLGSPSKAGITVRDATSRSSETLAISNLPAGSYVIEISRASGESAGAFTQGEVTLRLVNETRKVPFTLSGPRAELGTARLFFTSRLVPVDFGFR